jgi:hypothetical protein
MCGMFGPSVRPIVGSAARWIFFVANRGRPDLITFVAFMTKKVLHPTLEDGRKLLRAIYYTIQRLYKTILLRLFV